MAISRGWVTTAKNGMSAKTLGRMMGVSYHVAWHMLHRFRVAMVRSSREPLSGEVEVDESLIGGAEEGGKRGRGAKKEIVMTEVQKPKAIAVDVTESPIERPKKIRRSTIPARRSVIL